MTMTKVQQHIDNRLFIVSCFSFIIMIWSLSSKKKEDRSTSGIDLQACISIFFEVQRKRKIDLQAG